MAYFVKAFLTLAFRNNYLHLFKVFESRTFTMKLIKNFSSYISRQILLLLFILLFKLGFAQWNTPIALNTMIGAGIGNGNLEGVIFISPEVGMYSYSYYYSPSKGSEIWVKSTHDGGNTWNTSWNESIRGSTYELFAVNNQNTFYLVKNWEGVTKIDKTINKGNSWEYSGFGASGFYKDFCAIDTSNLFLLYRVIYADTMYKSYVGKYTNGVRNSKVASFYLEEAQHMFFVNADTGFIAASPARKAIDENQENCSFIYKSISGGTQWQKVFSDSLMNIRKLFFPSKHIGYAVGDSGKIIKTTNSGQNWQYIQPFTKLALHCTYFLNDTVGYVAGDSGLIFKTRDGGLSWVKQFTDIDLGFTKIFFVNDSIGFALSKLGLSKTFQNLSLGAGKFFTNLNRPQFYPNPFSTQTVLKLEKPLTNATLIVLNQLGQEVAKQEGINGNVVNFQRNELPNGLYYFCLYENNQNYSINKLVILEN